MSETTLTHRDLGRMLGVSETTIKSYRRKFPDCIPVANGGKPIRFTQEAGAVCLRIRELFSRGMAVPEVRDRLEKEFPWVGPATETPATEAAAPQPVITGPLEVELPQDYTQALSTLAKSMVNLTMRQDALLKKMESVDARLEQLGLRGTTLPEPSAMEESLSAAITETLAAWVDKAAGVIARLEQLSLREELASSRTVPPHPARAVASPTLLFPASEGTGSPSGTLHDTSMAQARTTAAHGNMEAQKPLATPDQTPNGQDSIGSFAARTHPEARDGATTSGDTDPMPREEKKAEPSGASTTAQSGAAYAKRIRVRDAHGEINEYVVGTTSSPAHGEDIIRTLSTEDTDSALHAAAHLSHGTDTATDVRPNITPNITDTTISPVPDTTPHTTESPARPSPIQEPPRALLTAPLVMQSSDGEFLGVAGKNRGRFSLNDLKAMFMSHYTGQERYSIHWELTAGGWQMTLEQKSADTPQHLTLIVAETVTPRGNSVSLIEQLLINSAPEKPVELHNIITSIYNA